MADVISGLFVMVVGVLAIIALSFLLSWPVFALWNGCLVGAVVGVQTVTWLQAWGITVLFGFLFKSPSSGK